MGATRDIGTRMHLDVPTLLVVGFTMSIGASIGFTLLLAVLPESPVLRLWVVSLWVSTLGVVLIGLRDQIPDFLSIVVGNGAISLASALTLKGIAVHMGRPWRWRGPLALVALFVVLMAWYGQVVPDLQMRFRLVSAGAVIWHVWAIALLLRHGAHEIRISRRLAAAIMGINAAFYATRFFIPITIGAGENVMKAGSPVAVTYIVGIVIGLAMYFALLILVTERLMVDLRRMAHIDGLTGLLNRSAIIAEGGQSMLRCRLREQPYALLIFDLDQFKRINDTWGHEAGDAVLQHFTAIVRRDAHWPASLTSRYGGEEFVLALPNASLSEAVELAERLRHTLAHSPAQVGEHMIPVTTSIGVAAAAGEMSFEQLVAQADEALYRAKSEGRNRVTHTALTAA
jgi:diguanylate cyclase (GGDEF)-like protein